jgi:uncharacterized LabA/DUF88 family protein
MEFKKFSDFTKQYPGENVQVFIDHSNLYQAVKSRHPGQHINYNKLAHKLISGRKIVRINMYISTLNPEWDPVPSRAQQAFISKLQSQPFVTVKCRPLRYTPDKKRDREKGIDILLATDMLSQAYFHGYDSLILVSGDGDYAPVLEEIKKMGKRVENAFLRKDRSDALRRVCDIFIDLDDNFLSECLIKKASPKK